MNQANFTVVAIVVFSDRVIPVLLSMSDAHFG